MSSNLLSHSALIAPLPNWERRFCFYGNKAYLSHMPIHILVIYSLVSLGFAWLLFNVGRGMMGTQSMRASLERYQKNPKQALWVEKYFYG